MKKLLAVVIGIWVLGFAPALAQMTLLLGAGPGAATTATPAASLVQAVHAAVFTSPQTIGTAISNSAIIGDQMIVVVNKGSTTPPTVTVNNATPRNLTLTSGPLTVSSTSSYLYVFNIQSGDPGSTITITTGSGASLGGITWTLFTGTTFTALKSSITASGSSHLVLTGFTAPGNSVGAVWIGTSSIETGASGFSLSGGGTFTTVLSSFDSFQSYDSAAAWNSSYASGTVTEAGFAAGDKTGFLLNLCSSSC